MWKVLVCCFIDQNLLTFVLIKNDLNDLKTNEFWVTEVDFALFRFNPIRSILNWLSSLKSYQKNQGDKKWKFCVIYFISLLSFTLTIPNNFLVRRFTVLSKIFSCFFSKSSIAITINQKQVLQCRKKAPAPYEEVQPCLLLALNQACCCPLNYLMSSSLCALPQYVCVLLHMVLDPRDAADTCSSLSAVFQVGGLQVICA